MLWSPLCTNTWSCPGSRLAAVRKLAPVIRLPDPAPWLIAGTLLSPPALGTGARVTVKLCMLYTVELDPIVFLLAHLSGKILAANVNPAPCMDKDVPRCFQGYHLAASSFGAGVNQLDGLAAGSAHHDGFFP